MAKTLFDLRMNDMQPFMSHGDCLHDHLRQAHALLTILKGAYHDAAVGITDDGITSTNPMIIGDAIEGIATLVALAEFHRAADPEERAQPVAVAA